jgi:uncharacterized protein (TIGR03437 family)
MYRALILAATLLPAFATTYDFVTFSGPGGTQIYPKSINNSGQIVGYYVDSAGASHGFLRATNGTITALDVPGATSTTAASISNTGWIAGAYATSGTTVGEIVGNIVNHGFRISPSGTLLTFDVPGASTTVALGVNGSGLVMGECLIPADASKGLGVEGFLLSPDGTTFTTFSTQFGADTDTLGMNDNGDIVGMVYAEEGSQRQAFLRLQSGTIATFAYGNDITGAVGINYAGQIAGFYETTDYVTHGFLQSADGTTYTTLDPPSYSSSGTVAINSSGQIAGIFGPWALRNADGSYTGVSVPGANSSSPAALNDSGQIAGVYVVPGNGTTLAYGFLATPMATTGGPQIRTYDGVISASGFGALVTAAPGSWIEIYGENLAGTTRSWQASDFTNGSAPTSLDSVRVSVNGLPAYVAYVSPEQVNALLPASVAAGTANVTVTYGASASPPQPISIDATAPGLLMFNGSLAPVFPNGTLVSLFYPGEPAGAQANPAHPGDTIVLYGTGFGPVTPPAVDGQVVTQLSSVQADVEFYLDGGPPQPPVPLAYSGLSIGSLGLYQFNFVVPTIAIPAGSTSNTVNLLWSVNGVMRSSYCAIIVVP